MGCKIVVNGCRGVLELPLIVIKWSFIVFFVVELLFIVIMLFFVVELLFIVVVPKP